MRDTAPPVTTGNQRGDEPLGDLFERLSDDLKALVRQEIAVGVAEVVVKARGAGKGLGFAGAGAALGYAGLLLMLAGLVRILGSALPSWLSALVVGAIAASIGATLVRKGLDILDREGIGPRQIAEAIEAGRTWAEAQAAQPPIG
ncbi:MAG: phage holin family protein [Chloroflexi bacterium]|nr:phage holin family protein [Chloroflexota bacterium]